MPRLSSDLSKALATVRATTQQLITAEQADRLAGATPYLRMLATLVGGWLMAKSALVAAQQLLSDPADASFYEAKIATATFFVTQTLPGVLGLAAAATGTHADLMAVSLDEY